jgi:hypothetical protein
VLAFEPAPPFCVTVTVAAELALDVWVMLDDCVDVFEPLFVEPV